MATTVGRLMPNRTPAEDANERFVFKTDTVGTDYEAFFALTPTRVKQIIQAAEVNGDLGPLYSIYDRMETTDTRYGGLAGQFKAAMGGLRLKVVPARTQSEADKELADDYANVMREVIARLDAETVTKEFASPYFTGATLYRLAWNLEDFAYGRKMWMPREVAPVEGQYLQSNKDERSDNYGKLEVRTDDAPNGRTVEGLPLGSSLLLESAYGHDRWAKIGVARKCLPWYLGIQFVQSWWIQYIEGYGSPLRIGRHPRGIDPKARMDMERFLQVLGQHGYALFPNDMEVQLIEANRAGSITTYGDFIRKGHEEYAIAMMGQASTTGEKGAAAPYAGAVVANSIRYEAKQDVANLIARGWRRLAWLVMRINYGADFNPRLLPHVSLVLVTPAEMSQKASVAVQAQDNGVAVPKDFWYEQVLGVEPPQEGEEAVLHGKVYVFGVDPEPKPKEQIANEAAAKQREKDQKAQRDRSVAGDGNPEYEEGAVDPKT